MLYDQRRKRGRFPLTAAARAPPTVRRTNPPAAATTTVATPPLTYIPTGRSAQSRILAALPRFSDAQRPPHYPREQQLLWTRRSATADTDTQPVAPIERIDVRKLIRHAHRTHKLLLDRLTVVHLRRRYRCELVDEIARLKRVLSELQAQVDATTRNVATMDRLVQHLQRVTSVFENGAAAAAQRIDGSDAVVVDTNAGTGSGDDDAVVVESTGPDSRDDASDVTAIEPIADEGDGDVQRSSGDVVAGASPESPLPVLLLALLPAATAVASATTCTDSDDAAAVVP